jgi:hypothetical protein
MKSAESAEKNFPLIRTFPILDGRSLRHTIAHVDTLAGKDFI